MRNPDPFGGSAPGEARAPAAPAADAALAASPCRHALLDQAGTVLYVDPSWAAAAAAAWPSALVPVAEGDDYRARCRDAAQAGSGAASVFDAGIAAVLNGHRADFSLTYPTARGEWLHGALAPAGAGRWLISHQPADEARRAREAADEMREELEQTTHRLERRAASARRTGRLGLHILAEIATENAGVMPTASVALLTRAAAAAHDLIGRDARRADESVSTRLLLTALVPILQQTIGETPLKLVVDDSPISSHDAMAIALIMTCLIEHARDTGAGPIEVDFTVRGNEKVLAVEFPGPPYEAEYAAAASDAPGLQIADNLARSELDGILRHGSARPGIARVAVTFTDALR